MHGERDELTATARVAHHPLPDRSVEAELKFELSGQADHARLRSRLRELDATFEQAYDEENLRLVRAGKTSTSLRLRVLNGGPSGVVTAKGPAKFERGIKIREETEVEVEDSQAMRDVFDAIGYKVAFTYHKHRESWLLDRVRVTLDTLDFGFFAELEGPADRLEERARELGLDPKKATKASYAAFARGELGLARKPRRVQVSPKL
jgi:predicted adenylyl cyclase CyaB